MQNKMQISWTMATQVLVIMAAAGYCHAANNATTKIGQWDDPTVWSGAIVPTNGQDVTVSHNVTLADSTADLASCTIAGATLTFTNWTTSLRATTVTVDTAGILTHALCGTDSGDPTNRIHIVCTDLTVKAGGKLNAKGLGYEIGPGGGGGGGATRSSGGHGGLGGCNSDNLGAGPVYGSAVEPIGPGSGGFVGGTTYRRGGGSVRVIATGNVVVDGVIDADGFHDTAGYTGCGSGGAIWITCRTFEGDGSLTARGDTSGKQDASGGGGGRIAVHCDATAQSGVTRPAVRISTAGGKKTTANVVVKDGEMGSIYLTDGQMVPTNMVNWAGQLVGPTNWAWPAMTMSTSTLRMGGPYDRASFTVDVMGNLTMQSNSVLQLYAGPSNEVWSSYGARVTVSNDWLIGSNCWLNLESHPTNGASPFLSMKTLTIQNGGGIDANAGGFVFSYGPGRPGTNTQNTTGGAYGGAGGGTVSSNTKTYGDANAPVDCGSPGFRSLIEASRGGGLVRVECSGQVTLDGVIRANGEMRSGGVRKPNFLGGGYFGAGSGGGIYIRCSQFKGGSTGALRADGGQGDYTDSAGGGGGRIAVWATLTEFDGMASATNGISIANCNYQGTPGTIVWGNIPSIATLISIR